MKRTALVLVAVIATALVVSLVGPFTFYANVVPVLGPVLPRAQGVPRQAAASYNWKASGMSWTWTRTFKHGCAAWMATDHWADVQLLVDSQCEDKRQSGHIVGRGLSYFSSEDHLTFQDYWPWSEDDHFKLIVFDANGMIASVRPCPYTLSANQIDALRIVAEEAHNEAQTDAERRVLARVKQRLAALNGTGLSSGQLGCTDLPIARDASIQRENAWTSH
ncbi:hypothetical protein [Devosia sp.]|uniref:hypothetical protein n=1 Tax=Devosia sp. TaxID=1871048 RepID=UPI002FCC623B